MSNFVIITLDTTPPSNPSLKINNGAIFSTDQIVNLQIGVGDSDTTGYMMKIWGDVDTAHSSTIKDTQEESSWIPFNTSQQVKLSNGDGSKRMYLIVRDDVHNASSQVSASIALDMSVPVVT